MLFHIIFNDYDGDEDENFKFDLKNINTDSLLRLREFLLSCDLLCYYNIMLEKKLYNIDSYINDIQEGIYPLTYNDLEKIGIKKPGHIFRILIKLEIDSGVIDNNLFNFIIEKINYRAYTTTTLALTSSINDIVLSLFNSFISFLNSIICSLFTLKQVQLFSFKSFLQIKQLFNLLLSSHFFSQFGQINCSDLIPLKVNLNIFFIQSKQK